MQDASREAEDRRNLYILDRAAAGVYIIGSGHLHSVERILSGRSAEYELVGGSAIT
jgi:hypothetical protein